jgi:hypothetical protein
MGITRCNGGSSAQGSATKDVGKCIGSDPSAVVETVTFVCSAITNFDDSVLTMVLMILMILQAH